ncbi:hypothetical protein BBP40_007674 [Aspergillus hancockii]|nr:hypothetical protein BBP40_007674 [Aspergillus hancockii]
MEFLCLPGSFGNETTFRAQLGPLKEELESTGSVRLHFTHGPIVATPPPEFQDYFGPPPNYRYLKIPDNLLSTVRTLPSVRTREQALEYLERGLKADGALESAGVAVNSIIEQIEQNDAIQGLIAYSEGASIAASVIIEEQRRKRETGRPVRIKCAVFISGWPAIDFRAGLFFAPTGCDDDEEQVEIPTCHVIGAEDVFLEGSKLLYDTCNVDNAELFDHGGGHIIPRNPRTLKELGDVIRSMIQESLSGN